ncbi:MAG TPA: tetratricopeptide repeat protein, partial [Gemmatales bacterium]|nr:tetratricopeptide repeat protein [Gemmatales bacterium]
MDAYAPCPCGSGKKFKWCCQPFWGEIAHVNKLNENHQYEAALAAIEQLTRKHPQNAEIWGRYAKQLWMMDRGAEAEAALDRALAANPRYAQGYLHKGTLRFSEMDLESAVGLFRKAAELTAPGDVNWLTLTLLQVCRVEYLLGRFLAAFTALDTAQRLAPNLAEAQELRQKFVANQHLLPSMQQSGAMRPAPAGLPAAAR